MTSKKKPENLLDFQELVMQYIKQGKHRLAALDAAIERIKQQNDQKAPFKRTDIARNKKHSK